MIHPPRTDCVRVLQVILALPFAHAGEAVVKWSPLKKLDDLAEKKDLAALRKIAASVKTAAEAVESEVVPKNAKQPEQVKILQGDLKSLTDSIHDPVKQDYEALTSLFTGIHPIVRQLMETSGMRHVDETDKKEKQAI